jgi:S1-C subfamily serine protease
MGRHLRNESMNLTELANTPAGSIPHFPPIFGTGFFIDSSGIVVTNRHVVDLFGTIPTHPKTGDSALAALLFLPGDNDKS